MGLCARIRLHDADARMCEWAGVTLRSCVARAPGIPCTLGGRGPSREGYCLLDLSLQSQMAWMLCGADVCVCNASVAQVDDRLRACTAGGASGDSHPAGLKTRERVSRELDVCSTVHCAATTAQAPTSFHAHARPGRYGRFDSAPGSLIAHRVRSAPFLRCQGRSVRPVFFFLNPTHAHVAHRALIPISDSCPLALFLGRIPMIFIL
ncbi:hypothetical protein B0H19DRAFT_1366552 [Mycena capillaripes]|nr:hypothetical protein B0H19DRAFT_1366552 [Mycena capillaripes]